MGLRQKLALQDCFVVLYAGIHGIAQGLEMLLLAAEQLQDRSAIRFLFVGEGPVKADLMALAQQVHLTNVIFHPQVAREEIPAFLSLAHLAVVPLRKRDLFKGALPSKLFDAWACACPTLITIDGEARAVLEEAGAGQWVEPEDAEALAAAIRSFEQSPEQLEQLGENGQCFVAQHYSRQSQARQLEQLLRTLHDR